MEPPGQHLVFVYGTLQRHQVNHGWLAGAGFEGRATLSGIALHDLGPFPMAVPGTGILHGELFRVSEATLAELDRLEGVPRLYQRHGLALADGRQVWVYLGRPRQVRHAPLLAAGRWLGAGLAMVALASPAAAFDTLGTCQSWRNSHGTARTRLGNEIGAAHYLTKVHRFQESPEEAPVELYSNSDLQRVCNNP